MLEDVVAYFQTQFQLKSEAYNAKGRFYTAKYLKTAKKYIF